MSSIKFTPWCHQFKNQNNQHKNNHIFRTHKKYLKMRKKKQIKKNKLRETLNRFNCSLNSQK